MRRERNLNSGEEHWHTELTKKLSTLQLFVNFFDFATSDPSASGGWPSLFDCPHAMRRPTFWLGNRSHSPQPVVRRDDAASPPPPSPLSFTRCRLFSRLSPLNRGRVVRALALTLFVIIFSVVEVFVLSDAGGIWGAVSSVKRSFEPRCSVVTSALRNLSSVETFGLPRERAGGVSMCLVFGGDASASLREWLIFHRAQGIRRVMIAWNFQAHEGASFAEPHRAVFDAVVKPFVEMGFVDVVTVNSVGARVAAVIEGARRARAASNSACAPSASDDRELERQLRHCTDPDRYRFAAGENDCQMLAVTLCLSQAQLLGDEWMGHFDGDELVFAPPSARPECFWGGRPSGEEPGRLRARESGLDAARGSGEELSASCVVRVPHSAPLLTGHNVRDALADIPGVFTVVALHGAAFGLAREDTAAASNWIERFGRTSPADSAGRLVGLPAEFGGRNPSALLKWLMCPEWFCGMAGGSVKSFTRVQGVSATGLRVHKQATGLLRSYYLAPGAPLRYNHFILGDRESLTAKATSINAGRAASYRAILDNKMGLLDYMSTFPDESSRALLPVLRYCNDESKWRETICGGM